MRRKFLYFLRFKVSKVPECMIDPFWIQIIKYILFPINSFLFQRFDYSVVDDSVFIYGQRYSRMFFEMCNSNEVSQEWFQFVKNKKTGVNELYRRVDVDFIHKDIVREEIEKLQNEIFRLQDKYENKYL